MYSSFCTDEEAGPSVQPPLLSQAPSGVNKRGGRIGTADPLDTIREALGVLQTSISRGPSAAGGRSSSGPSQTSQLPLGFSGVSAIAGAGATQSSVLLATQSLGSGAAGGGAGGADRQSLHATIAQLQVREVMR